MKKMLFLLMLIPFVGFGQTSSDHIAYYVTANDSTNTYSITATADDTSLIFLARETMAFKLYGVDAATDSVDIDFTLQTSTWSSSGNWTTEGSYTLDANSTWESWKITAAPISPDTYYRLIVTGGSDNKTLAAITVTVVFSGYPRKRN